MSKFRAVRSTGTVEHRIRGEMEVENNLLEILFDVERDGETKTIRAGVCPTDDEGNPNGAFFEESFGMLSEAEIKEINQLLGTDKVVHAMKPEEVEKDDE